MHWTEQTTDGLVLAVIIVVGLLVVREFYERQIRRYDVNRRTQEAEEAVSDRREMEPGPAGQIDPRLSLGLRRTETVALLAVGACQRWATIAGCAFCRGDL